MDRNYSGGMSWADQWDYSEPVPPLPPAEVGEKGKKGKESSKAKSRFKRVKMWFKEVSGKKSGNST